MRSFSDRKGRAQEEEEVLRRAEQAKRDEEFARKLQEELDSAPTDPAPQPSETLSDHELARRLQVRFFLLGPHQFSSPEWSNLHGLSLIQVSASHPLVDQIKPGRGSSLLDCREMWNVLAFSSGCLFLYLLWHSCNDHIPAKHG